jgi:hypothetical protein
MPAAGSTAATVFGLDVRSQVALPFLDGARAAPTGRTLQIREQANDPRCLPWRDTLAPVCDQRDGEGRVVLRIEAHPRDGYLIWGPGHGAHLLSSDGLGLRCDRGGSPDGRWQRLLIAQVLPFAALLQGLESLHASAVALAGEAIAVLGDSGAGKTSVALALCSLGADFLADDVVALEMSGETLLAHPGAPVAGLAHAEALRLERTGQPREEPAVAENERERVLSMRGAAAPVPLRSLFLLDRRRDGPATARFEPVEGARSLLSATFNFVLATPERLQRLLDATALAARCRVERVVAGPLVDATQLAAAIAQRVA